MRKIFMMGIAMVPLLVTLTASALIASSANIIQDSKKAEQFFQDELNFTTNPHEVNDVVQGIIKNVTIVDLRTEKDFAQGHIPGAINLPYDKYNGFKGDETTFPGLRKDSLNYVYCYELLCNLGQQAAKKFAQTGYPVKEMKGGFKSWKEGQYRIEK